jgi:DNA replication ATP-dependent helicase Dna2
LRQDKTNEPCTLHLRDDWIATPVEADNLINVIGIFTNKTCIIDNLTGMIILHPDTLVSSTHVADSFKCIRRAVLQDHVKATGETTKPLVYGSMIHELFQQAISVMDFSTAHLESIIDTLVIQHIEQLYSINITPTNARADLREKIWLLQAWADVFVVAQPSVYSFMADHCGSNDAKPKVSITKVLDIEEHIWSPTYGLKGNIDATVEIALDEPDTPRRHLVVPLEVKTGKNTSLMNHRAQTMLYTLMMSDRYDVDVLCGLLYYVDAKETIRVRALRNEVRGLIMGRNELARWIKLRDGLPEMLQSPRDCKGCYAADSCLVYHKVCPLPAANETLENGTDETSGLGTWFDEQTGHLDDRDAAFLKHWNTLLTKEEGDIFRFRNELWTMLSADREKLGRLSPQRTLI